MSSTMFDAREALIRGSVYDRTMPTAPMDPAAFHDTYFHTHDRLSYIGAERTIPPAAAARIPVPVGMFIPPVPPPHHSYFGQVVFFLTFMINVVLYSVATRKQYYMNALWTEFLKIF